MTYYFTYGSDHLDKHGNSLGRSCTPIEAESRADARAIMINLRGGKFCTDYPTPEEAGVERFDLRFAPSEQIDLRGVEPEKIPEEEAEKVIASRREELLNRLNRLEILKRVIVKLPIELMSKCREYCGKLDIDGLNREEVVLVLSTLEAGKWIKSQNTAYEGTLDYHGTVDGVAVRLWAAGPPESCRFVEYEEVIPEQKVTKRKLVCTPE